MVIESKRLDRQSAAGAGALSLAATGCVKTEKSENPLSPTVAGPIAGVNITQPQPVEPSQGIRIANNLQPVTLSLQNAATTGVRPISYRFEIATDVELHQHHLRARRAWPRAPTA